MPAGSEPAAPACQSIPAVAEWGSMSQLAVFIACQIPFKLGLPSAVRGALYAGAWLIAGIASSSIQIAMAMPILAVRNGRFILNIRNSRPRAAAWLSLNFCGTLEILHSMAAYVNLTMPCLDANSRHVDCGLPL